MSTTTARTPEQLFRTATHECGHAVAAHLLRSTVRKVTIEPDETCYGHCRYFVDDLTPFRDRLRIILAGAAAVRAEAGIGVGFMDDFEGSRDDPNSDASQAWTLAKIIMRNEDAARLYLGAQRADVDAWVRESHFVRLVRALRPIILERRTMYLEANRFLRRVHRKRLRRRVRMKLWLLRRWRRGRIRIVRFVRKIRTY